MDQKPPKISFEFFPPKSLQASFDLWESLNILTPLQPTFVSVTYGAGGTTRQLTREMTEAVASKYGLDVAAHLTCVDASRAETLAIAKSYVDAGVSRIVALRGDPPKGAGKFVPHPHGYADSVDLVAGLAATGVNEIYVGAYPEPHPEAAHENADIDWLKRKFDAGASAAITQFFSTASCFCGSATGAKKLVSTSRSFQASYRSKIGRIPNALPPDAAPAFQPSLTLSL